MRNRLQSTAQDFRYSRSPAEGESVVPDWLIKCQRKSACQSKFNAPFRKTKRKEPTIWFQENLETYLQELEQDFLVFFKQSRNTL